MLNNSISFDKIANPMLSRMTPYDEEVSLPTSNLGLVLRKSFSSQLNMTTTLSILNNEVTMPSLQDLDISNTPIVNLLVSKSPIVFFSFTFFYLSRDSRKVFLVFEKHFT